MTIASAGNAAAITPDDDNDLPGGVTRGIYCGVTGNVVADMENGETVTFVGLAAGVVHPLRIARVYETDTTATNLVAIY